MRPMVPYKATAMSMPEFSTAIDAELPIASTCMHQSSQQLRKLATHGRKIPVIPRQRKHRINTLDAEANELADVTYVQFLRKPSMPKWRQANQTAYNASLPCV